MLFTLPIEYCRRSNAAGAHRGRLEVRTLRDTTAAGPPAGVFPGKQLALRLQQQ